ncbi:potassium channel subfamily T member 2-like [Pecten maximus]|uniref:potassium channel subfamily T member 2-like n=1 Tax=Pecten maximus TaxID=6579 RepID=UPI00145864C3|nr:potassium channel subfamily T member 2-like [Pecten maximus]
MIQSCLIAYFILEDHVLCGDEVKFAILANNCLYPGFSALVTLLIHSTTIEAESNDMEPWQQLYGRQSRNSLYSIQLNQSKVFRRYRGWSFTLASADAHKRYGVGLLAVLDKTRHDSRIRLNPGDGYKLRDFDCLLYISDVAEDVMSTSRLVSGRGNAYVGDDHIRDNNNNPPLHMIENLYRGREPSIVSSPWEETLQGCDLQNTTGDDSQGDNITLGRPPSTFCASTPTTQCYVMEVRRPDCCLQWDEDCDHCAYRNARHDLYGRQLIILAAEEECAGIMNFLVPLRSHTIEKDELRTIVLLLQKQPSDVFMETIARFPQVFWIEGSITSVDDLIKSGIHKATHLVVANIQSSLITDSDTLFAVRKIQRLFPNTNVITELNHASNIRFLHNNVPETINIPVAILEKTLKEKMSSTLPHLFRQHFAAGKVFSTSMLDNLMYQTFVKHYLIMFVRRLAGIETENNTGYLSSIRVDGVTSSTYTTYGELYYSLTSTSGKVPLAIYRTRNSKTKTDQNASKQIPEQKSSHQFEDTQDHVCGRLKSLGMDSDAYISGLNQEQSENIPYVVLNPTSDTKLIDGDIVYVLQPASFLGHPRQAMSTEVMGAQMGQEVHV